MASENQQQVNDDDGPKKLEFARLALMEINELVSQALSWIPNGTTTKVTLTQAQEIIIEALGKTELPVAGEDL